VEKRIEDGGAGPAGVGECAECGLPLRAGQRYCLECGARQVSLPAVVASRIDALMEGGRAGAAPTADDALPGSEVASAAAAEAGAAGSATEKDDRWWFMPSPQIAAVAVMALLAAGVVLGAVTSPPALSAATTPIVLDMGGSEAPEPETEPEPEAVASVPAEPAAAVPAAAPAAPAALPEEVAEAPEEPAGPAPKPLELPEEETLPEIKHVFLIVLDGHGYEEAFGPTSSAPYLSKTLAGEGKLLSNYYAVAQGGLANEIALLSGQGPTPQTAANCPESTSIAPGTVSAEGQVEGQGCVYPATTETLPGQLVKAKSTWRAYVEPGPLEPWRNPFAYFAALGAATGGSTGQQAPLEELATDLKKAEKTPTLSYIVPNACHDGSETPCAEGQPAGLAATGPFLEAVVPEITASPAYKEEGGLIAITFDQAPQAGPATDSSSCCGTPAYPNLPAPPGAEPLATGPVKPSGGGGRVGLLLISPYLAPGTVEESAYFNHFSLLRSIEELLGQEPLGYAAEPALTGFEPSLFDAAPEESTVSPKE
jgi:phosphatidylinositol-3-phosphatase